MLYSVLAMLLLGLLFREASNPCCAAVFGYGCVDSGFALRVLRFVFLVGVCSMWSLLYVLLESFCV